MLTFQFNELKSELVMDACAVQCARWLLCCYTMSQWNLISNAFWIHRRIYSQIYEYHILSLLFGAVGNSSDSKFKIKIIKKSTDFRRDFIWFFSFRSVEHLKCKFAKSYDVNANIQKWYPSTLHSRLLNIKLALPNAMFAFQMNIHIPRNDNMNLY